MFNNMSLGAKILGGFIIAILFTVTVGIVSYFSANKIMTESDEIIEELMPVADMSMELHIAHGNMMFRLYSVMLEKTDEEKALFREAMGEYEKLMKDSKTEFASNKDLLEKINAFEDDYSKTDAEMEKIIAAIGGKEEEEVVAKYMPAVDSMYVRLRESYEALEKETEKSINLMMNEADQAQKTGIAAIALMTVSAVVICILLAFFLTNSIVGPVNKAIESLNFGSDQVATAANQITGSGQELAQGASEQASSLEETSSSLEEMTSMVQQNAENARMANTMASDANKVTSQGIESMKKLGGSITEIQTSSNETAKIIKTIDDIAFQTNLLALNAAVEAARAGEAGKGFAVVAEEVRNLAKRSAEAAKNTSELIAGSQKNVDNGVKVTEEVGKILNDIGTNVTKVTNLIGEVAAASEEQARGIEQLNSAVAEMDKVTQRNSANAEESASAAEELSSQAAELKEMVVVLQKVVGQKDSSGNAQKTVQHHVWQQPQRQQAPAVAANVHNILHNPGNAVQKKKVPVAAAPSKGNGGGRKSNPEKIIPLSEDPDLKEF